MGIPQEGPARVVWAPQDGPQTALLTCPIFETAFGGARGGGKTDGVLGDWVKHSHDGGRFATGIMVRRHLTELEETIARSHEIFGPLGARYHTQSKTWTMPWKARLKFRFIERDIDAMLYQGHSYCVAVGTRIAMADGSFRKIEAIAVGDMVATLEGPRRVQASIKPYLAPCVRALVRDDLGAVVGEQIHPVWHPVLTIAGLSASNKFPIRQKERQSRGEGPDPYKQDEVSLPRGRSAPPAWAAYGGDDRIDCKESLHAHQEAPRPRLLIVPVVLHGPSAGLCPWLSPVAREAAIQSHFPRRSLAPSQGLLLATRAASQWLMPQTEPVRSVLGFVGRVLASGRAYARTGLRITADSLGDCRGGYGSGDARALRESGIGQAQPQRSADAGSKPHASLSGASGTTPEHSQTEQLWWAHPYTGEARHLSEPVASGTMELRPCGMAWVMDLSVEGANHYISDCGLINKNSRVYIEEAGNFPLFDPIQKLFATLRSGHGLPVGMRLTGNPGGPGHQWFKARYISPAPLGYKVIEEVLPSGRILQRVFIPSKVTDNKIMMANDPGYVDRLHMVGSPELVKAWLYGDWDIVAGAFFHHWGPKMVVPAFVPPPGWSRFMSMDWGSAKPFSVHWWAVADGMPVKMSGGKSLWIPRGAIVAYREWYGMKSNQPNVGIKLDAEELADGIMKREAAAGEYPGKGNLNKTQIVYRVGDPSMWKVDGGPSIAERMARYRPSWDKDKVWEGIYLRPADNSRITGWDQMHARMRGFDERPMIYFTEDCPHAIRTIPTLQHDPLKMEDLDTEAEDHAADGVRYGCMSRPMPSDPPPSQMKPSAYTFDQVTKVG